MKIIREIKKKKKPLRARQREGDMMRTFPLGISIKIYAPVEPRDVHPCDACKRVDGDRALYLGGT